VLDAKNSSPVGIILISIKSKYRSDRLLEVVRASGIPFLELNASTPESMFNLVRQSRIGQLTKIGRLLTKKEFATFESHFRAQTSVFAKRYEWIVIFEDDAIINERSIGFLNSIALMKSHHPIHINLYPNRGILFSNDRFDSSTCNNILKVDYLYPGAVAYALNSAARSKIAGIRSHKVITPIDFPPIFNTFDKYIYFSEEAFSHSEDVESLVYDSSGIPENNKLLQAFGFSSLLGYLLFRKEHQTLLNYLDLEFRQRRKRRSG
jgi:GR25 family glycosyltransferase involved in LPS biosynthesis